MRLSRILFILAPTVNQGDHREPGVLRIQGINLGSLVAQPSIKYSVPRPSGRASSSIIMTDAAGGHKMVKMVRIVQMVTIGLVFYG